MMGDVYVETEEGPWVAIINGNPVVVPDGGVVSFPSTATVEEFDTEDEMRKAIASRSNGKPDPHFGSAD